MISIVDMMKIVSLLEERYGSFIQYLFGVNNIKLNNL